MNPHSLSFFPKLKARLHMWRRKPLRRSSEHEKIVSCRNVQDASVHEVEIKLEGAFYHTPSVLEVVQEGRQLYQLKDVWVVGKQGFVYFDQDDFFDACPGLKKLADKKLPRPVRRFAREIEGPVFHLTGRNARNRAHFLVEQLPRLVACMDAMKEVGDYKILLAPEAAAWQRPLLQKLGIPGDRCIEGTKGTLLIRDLYYVPMLWSNPDDRLCSPAYYEKMRQAVFAASKTRAVESRPSIFVTRGDAKVRKLLNEDAVYDACSRFFGPLESVSMSELTPDEQINLFREASVVIGPHGQPFRNSLFADDCAIIQLSNGSLHGDFRTRKWCDVFSALGTIGGNRCVTLYSDTELNSKGDWEFPVDLLIRQCEALEHMLGDPVESGV